MGHFRVHSWELGLYAYFMMHSGHDFSQVPKYTVPVTEPKSKGAVDKSSGCRAVSKSVAGSTLGESAAWM